jgi:hypothetical protein
MKRHRALSKHLAKILLLTISSSILLLLSGSGCGAHCEPLMRRCNGQVLELCDPKGHWRHALDCSEIEPGVWTCVTTPDAEQPSLRALCKAAAASRLEAGVEADGN